MTRLHIPSIVFTGLVAGIVATIIQIALWWLFNMPLLESLFRDTRLAAAVLLGTDIIAAPLLFTKPTLAILAAATLLHFALSIAYAAVYAWLEPRLPRLLRKLYPALGAFFGLLIYLVNMYGFTEIFPWFSGVRDIPTLLAHLVFGITVAIALRPGGFANSRRRQESRLSQDTILG